MLKGSGDGTAVRASMKTEKSLVQIMLGARLFFFFYSLSNMAFFMSTYATPPFRFSLIKKNPRGAPGGEKN